MAVLRGCLGPARRILARPNPSASQPEGDLVVIARTMAVGRRLNTLDNGVRTARSRWIAQHERLVLLRRAAIETGVSARVRVDIGQHEVAHAFSP